ncbi:MAG: mechanosensitive ion channel family protein [Polyangiaceae bacterium]|nr:mechanosensitive ion channel family protein [Polyangiaceae bacterium]
MTGLVDQLVADPTARKLAGAALAALVTFAAFWLLRRVARRGIEDARTRYQVTRVLRFVGYLSVVVVFALAYSDKLRSLGLTLGVAGAGIAFALQEVIVSVAGWLAVSSGGFYKTGDRVQLGGIRGDVIDIGVLRTTLMEIGEWVKGDIYTGRVVRVANSFVFKQPVFNYSGEFPFLWDEVTIPVKYGSDVKLARRMLERVAQEVAGDVVPAAKERWAELSRRYLLEQVQIEPLVTLSANDNWIEFTVRYVVDYKLRRLTKDRLFSRVLEEVDASPGRVALASATFHLVEAPRIDVRLVGPESPSPS